jgi:hypothetical protein
VTTARKNNTPEKVPADVEFYLEGTDRSRVFYHREYNEDEDGHPVQKVRRSLLPCPRSYDAGLSQGMFQSYPIARTFGSHCLATGNIDGTLGPLACDPELKQSLPEGALTLSIQAVRRHIYSIFSAR